MIQRTFPVPFPRQALLIRNMVDQVSATKTPADLSMKRPEGLPTVSVCILAKNEHETLIDCVSSVIPLASEIIIGVDDTTDDPLSFAYREAFLSKGQELSRKFFDKFLKEERLASMEEIAAFIGVSTDALKKRCDKALRNGKPTRIAAEKCLEMVGKGKVVDISFNDHFSNSRNALLPYCTGELCMFIDGHEFLDNVSVLMDCMVKAEVEMPYYKVFGIMVNMIDSPILERNRQVRIWRNLPGVQFYRGVHNRLKFPEEIKQDEVYPTIDSAMLIHNRPAWLALYREPQRQKMVNQYMGGDCDTPSLYYEGLGFMRVKEWAKAIECYKQYIEQSPPGPESAMVCWYLGRCYEDGLGEKENGLEWYKRGIEKCPDAAFCHLAIVMSKLRREEGEEDGAVKRRLLAEALAHATFAQHCSHPGGTIAVPVHSFTWDALQKKAEVLRRLERYDEAAEALESSLQYAMEDQRVQDIQVWVWEMRRLNYEKIDKQMRLSLKDGNRHLYIVDPSQFHGQEVFLTAEANGYEVRPSAIFNLERFFEADVTWMEHVDEMTVAASNIVRSDRRLIIRIFPEDFATGLVGKVNWSNVDKAYLANESFEQIKVTEGIPESVWDRFSVLPVIPKPERYQLQANPQNKDVVAILSNGDEWVLPLLPEIAQAIHPRALHVGGFINGQALYEEVAKTVDQLGIQNITFCGRVHPNEVGQFMFRGGNYVSLASGYDQNQIIAQMMGLSTFVFGEADFSSRTIRDLARSINEGSPTGTVLFGIEYTEMVNEIAHVLE